MRPARLVLLYAYFLWSSVLPAVEEPASQIVDNAPAASPGFSFRYLELLPQASIITPGNLVLENSLFRVPYSDSATGMPSLGLGLGVPLAAFGRFDFAAVAQVSYRFKHGSFAVQNSEGLTLQDKLTLHWIPFSGALRVGYEMESFTYAKPTLTLGAGTQWFSQSGRLSGISGSFWVPYAFISPALTFLEARTPNDWFGGFTFGTTLYRALTDEQIVEGLCLDLSVNIIL